MSSESREGTATKGGEMKRIPVLLCAASLAITACGSSSPKSSTAPSSPSRTSATASATASAAAPVVAQSSLLAGNAHPHYPAGTPGQVSVVYQAPVQPQSNGTSVPIVIRNNTNAAIAHVDITATTKDPSGKIVASGSSQETDPSTIDPGQWGLSFIFYMPGTALAANDTLSFSFQTMPATTSSYNTAAIQVTQANLSGSFISGGVQNTTGHAVQGPVSVNVYCLNSAGDPTSTVGGFTSGSSGNLAVGATDSFQIGLYDQSCPSFLVGASGFYS